MLKNLIKHFKAKKLNKPEKSRKPRPYKIKNRFYIEAKYLEELGFKIGTPLKYIFQGSKAIIFTSRRIH